MFLHLFRIDLVIFLLCFAISIVVRWYIPILGGISGYFDPFVDNEIDLDEDALPASKVLSDKTVPHSLSCKSPFALDIVTSSSSKTAFMTDEGHTFPSVVKVFGWTHCLDCRHFALQILTAWHGISDPKQFILMCMIFLTHHLSILCRHC